MNATHRLQYWANEKKREERKEANRAAAKETEAEKGRGERFRGDALRVSRVEKTAADSPWSGPCP